MRFKKTRGNTGPETPELLSKEELLVMAHLAERRHGSASPRYHELSKAYSDAVMAEHKAMFPRAAIPDLATPEPAPKTLPAVELVAVSDQPSDSGSLLSA